MVMRAQLLLTRRELLAGVSSLALASMAHSQDVRSRTVFVVLKGIDQLTDGPTIESLVDVFSSNQIPVSLFLSDLTGPDSPTDASLQTSLRRLSKLLSEHSFVEFILPHTPQESPHRYLHLRAAAQLKSDAEMALGELGADATAASFVSIYDLSPDDVLEPYAYRSAGWRIQIRRDNERERNDQTDVAPVDWGILKIRGGIYRDIASSPEEAIEAVIASSRQQLLMLDLTDSLNQSSEWLISRMRQWANLLNTEIAGGGLLATLPKDYLLQGNPGASKVVALVIEVGPSGQMAPELAEFTSLLDEIGVPYTIISTPPVDSSMNGQIQCSIETVPSATAQLPYETCVMLSDGERGIDQNSPATFVLHSPGERQGWIGPGADARFHVFLKAFETKGLLQAIREDPLTDGLELISSADVKSKFQQIVLARAVEQAHRDGRIRFATLPELRDFIAAPDEVVKRVWSVRRREAANRDVAQAGDIRDRAALFEDAEIAWHFLEKHTHETTGLCAGTVMHTSNAAVVNNDVTLWDIGSQIQGIIGALKLGLVDEQTARTATAIIIENIPVASIGEFRLPYASFNAKTLTPVLSGFDAGDTGRFLIALRSAVAAGLVETEAAQSLISSWDLNAAVRDGHVFSFSRNRWVDTFASHSTHYIKHGYAFAGIELDTPYPTLPTEPSGDHLVRLLYAVAEIGHYGAEPGLLDAIEGIQSPENHYLAQVLFDAQLRYFEKTGNIRCVSETPISFPPWFIYYGLRVDLKNDAEWVVAARGASTTLGRLDDQTPYRMISTKAVFLWAATFPHAHTSRLLALVRGRGRIDGLGYASGLLEETQNPMTGYSDLNTNGIILSSVSKILSE
jgi:hypothetical protein